MARTATATKSRSGRGTNQYAKRGAGTPKAKGTRQHVAAVAAVVEAADDEEAPPEPVDPWAGVKDDVVAEWAVSEIGADASEWFHRHFDLKDAEGWVTYRFSPDEAGRWGGHVSDHREAFLYRAAGFGPRAAGGWFEHKINHAEARKLTDMGFTPGDVSRWKDAGFGPGEAERLRAGGFGCQRPAQRQAA